MDLVNFCIAHLALHALNKVLLHLPLSDASVAVAVFRAQVSEREKRNKNITLLICL